MTRTPGTSLKIARMRLINQHIEGSRFTRPGEVVSWLGAVQAQDYSGAVWSIGLRLPGSTTEGIEKAIADKTLIRTWVMRGTLHIVRAADIRWMLSLISPRIIAGNRRRYQELGLDEETLGRSNRVIAEVLHGGMQLNRTELLAILEKNGIPAFGQRGPYMLQRASLNGLICQGIMHRNNPTFIALDESVPEGRIMGREKALEELAFRYFSSHGPATLQDFAGWSGLTVAEARAGLDAIMSQLTQETVDGRIFWQFPSDLVEEPLSSDVYLLPGFDEYVLGYHDRSAVLDVLKTHNLVLKNGMLTPTIIIGGKVAGIWKRTFWKGTVRITSNLFSPMTAGEHEAYAAAAHRYGKFLRMPIFLQ